MDGKFRTLIPTGVSKVSPQQRNRLLNGQKKKYKRTNNDIQNIHIKLKIEYHEPN
jgi:hypothetical protein